MPDAGTQTRRTQGAISKGARRRSEYTTPHGNDALSEVPGDGSLCHQCCGMRKNMRRSVKKKITPTNVTSGNAATTKLAPPPTCGATYSAPSGATLIVMASIEAAIVASAGEKMSRAHNYATSRARSPGHHAQPIQQHVPRRNHFDSTRPSRDGMHHQKMFNQEQTNLHTSTRHLAMRRILGQRKSDNKTHAKVADSLFARRHAQDPPYQTATIAFLPMRVRMQIVHVCPYRHAAMRGILIRHNTRKRTVTHNR